MHTHIYIYIMYMMYICACTHARIVTECYRYLWLSFRLFVPPFPASPTGHRHAMPASGWIGKSRSCPKCSWAVWSRFWKARPTQQKPNMHRCRNVVVGDHRGHRGHQAVVKLGARQLLAARRTYEKRWTTGEVGKVCKTEGLRVPQIAFTKTY